jgi:hypothetical protein
VPDIRNIRGPMAFLSNDGRQIDVDVGCRLCGWAASKSVLEDDVHRELELAAQLFTRHKCRGNDGG